MKVYLGVYFLIMLMCACESAPTEKHMKNDSVFVDVSDTNHMTNKVIDSLHLLFKSIHQESELTEQKLQELKTLITSNDSIVLLISQDVNAFDWFHEIAGHSFFNLILKKNKQLASFNGYQYLYEIEPLYQNNSELSERISICLGEMAAETPRKFLMYLESLEQKSERAQVLSKTQWSDNIYRSIDSAIKGSSYETEIRLYAESGG